MEPSKNSPMSPDSEKPKPTPTDKLPGVPPMEDSSDKPAKKDIPADAPESAASTDMPSLATEPGDDEVKAGPASPAASDMPKDQPAPETADNAISPLPTVVSSKKGGKKRLMMFA